MKGWVTFLQLSSIPLRSSSAICQEWYHHTTIGPWSQPGLLLSKWPSRESYKMAQAPLPMCHFFIVWSSVLQDGVSVSLHSLHCFLAAPPLGVNSLSGNSSAEFETEGLLFPNLKGEVSILHAWYGFHKVNSLWINSICWFLCFQLLFVIWFPFWEASGDGLPYWHLLCSSLVSAFYLPTALKL